MTSAPLVTVLIPARNEARDIRRCLECVLRQDLPLDRLEVVLVDGGSTDETASIAREVLEQADIRWSIVSNDTASTPSSLNAGLAVASGRYICRVDARSLIPPEYVRSCAALLELREDVAVVGGAQVAAQRDDTPQAIGIARALNNRYLMGGSRYRSGSRSGETDTVYLGAFRRADLLDHNGWDERFPTNQDFELNRRLRKVGNVWFDHRLQVRYLPRGSIRGLFEQYLRFGRWKVRYWKLTNDRPRPRQVTILAAAFGSACVLCFLVRRSERRIRLLSGAALGTCAMVSVLDLLSNGRPVSLKAHLRACEASVAVAAGWLAGVSLEAGTLVAKPGRRTSSTRAGSHR